MALAELYPALHFVVQMSEPASINGAVEGGKAKELTRRITVQERVPGRQQTVKDAAVYILHLPMPSPGMSSDSIPASILAELRAHFGVLRANRNSVTLILAPRLLPEPGSVDPDIEAIARTRDLSHLQLANEREMEIGELVEMVKGVHDSTGWLVVANSFRSRNSATMALSIKYQAYADRLHGTEPTVV